jgi:hypothetical protein
VSTSAVDPHDGKAGDRLIEILSRRQSTASRAPSSALIWWVWLESALGADPLCNRRSGRRRRIWTQYFKQKKEPGTRK